jgi:hypothetical protein
MGQFRRPLPPYKANVRKAGNKNVKSERQIIMHCGAGACVLYHRNYFFMLLKLCQIPEFWGKIHTEAEK